MSTPCRIQVLECGPLLQAVDISRHRLYVQCRTSCSDKRFVKICTLKAKIMWKLSEKTEHTCQFILSQLACSSLDSWIFSWGLKYVVKPVPVTQPENPSRMSSTSKYTLEASQLADKNGEDVAEVRNHKGEQIHSVSPNALKPMQTIDWNFDEQKIDTNQMNTWFQSPSSKRKLYVRNAFIHSWISNMKIHSSTLARTCIQRNNHSTEMCIVPNFHPEAVPILRN